MKINLYGAFFILLVIGAWQAIISFGLFPSALFAPPTEVFAALTVIALSGELANQILASFWRAILGLAIGSAAGIFLGIMMGRNVAADKTASPFLNILRAFPPVAMIPLFIIWLGITDFSKVLAIALAVFFPVWVSALAGAKQIPLDYIRAAKLLTKSKIKTFFCVILPASTPQIISGIRIGIALAFIMVFVTELAGASTGLGFFISNAQITYRIDNLLAGLIVLGLLAASIDYLFAYSAKKILPWVSINEK